MVIVRVVVLGSHVLELLQLAPPFRRQLAYIHQEGRVVGKDNGITRSIAEGTSEVASRLLAVSPL